MKGGQIIMPLQWLNLQNTGNNKNANSPKSPQRKFLGTMDTTNSFIERQKEKWKAEDDAIKQKREMEQQGAQEMGMRFADILKNMQQQQQQTDVQQQEMAKKEVEKMDCFTNI